MTSSPRAGHTRLDVLAAVHRALRLLETLGVELLDRVGGARNEILRVVVRLEVGEDVVGERARIAAPGTADTDAQPEKVGRLQVLCDRAQTVVPGEPPSHLQLEPAEIEVAFVV